MGPAAGFAFAFVPGELIVVGDADATAANLVRSAGLLRLAVASHVFVLFADVAVAVLLYRLLRPVGATLSMLAAVFRIAMATMRGATLVNLLVALRLVGGARHLQAFSAEQRHALALQSYEAFDAASKIDLTFFAVHLLLLGWLVVRSGYLPRLLGVLLAIGGVGYLVDGLSALLAPRAATNLAVIVGWGELVLALYLVIRGVRAQGWDERKAIAS